LYCWSNLQQQHKFSTGKEERRSNMNTMSVQTKDNHTFCTYTNTLKFWIFNNLQLWFSAFHSNISCPVPLVVLEETVNIQTKLLSVTGQKEIWRCQIPWNYRKFLPK
jgi:hypothetical protein